MDLLRDPDAELVAACRNPADDGFEAAFERLYLKYRDRVYSIAYRITGSATDAMDVAQESFSLLFRKLDSFRFDSLFSTWLFRIVVNCSIDHRRRERARTRLNTTTLDQDDEDLQDDAAGPSARAETNEVGAEVQRAIQMLSPKLRAILALRYLEEMSYETLAVTLGLSLGTVKSRLARAHLALEKIVRERFPHLDLGGTASDLTGEVG